MDERRKGPLLVFGLVHDRRIDGPSHSMNRTRGELFVQRFALPYQRNAEMFSNHPLHMLCIESRLEHPWPDALFREHFQEALVGLRIMSWITEDAQPAIEVARTQ